MSYTYEKISSNQVKLTFEVAAEDFEAAMQAAYLRERKRIMVPGFRKGHAPRKLIETMYGADVFVQDAVEDIANKEYPAALEAEKIDVVDRPVLDVQQAEPGKPLQFTCTVYVRPDVTLGQYKGLEVEVARQVVTQEMIDARIAQDQDKQSRQVEVLDRPVENGDTVHLDYAGTVDGVAFEGGTAENQTLVIGSDTFIPGFEAQMVGMCVGEERDLNVTFPEKYHSDELAGKAAVFHVKVISIEKTEKPEVNDEFAQDNGYDNLEAYKAAIVAELQEAADKRRDSLVENALVEKAVEGATVDIPEAMITDQAGYLVREMEMNMAYQGLRMQDYLRYTNQTIEDLRAQYRPEAEKRTKTELVLEAIRKAEGIEPTEEEIHAQAVEQAKRMGQDPAEFEKGLSEAQKGYLRDSAAIQKVLELMKSTAVITEKDPEADKPGTAAEE